VNKLLPLVNETKEETKSEQLGTTPPTSEYEALLSELKEAPAVIHARGDFHDSQNPTLSHNM